MSVDKSTVVRIAELARIRVPEEELEKLAGELAKILEWVERLNEVDTEGVARDRILANAPERRDGFFAVPKVIE